MIEYKVLGHSSIRIKGSKTIYVDPFELNKEYKDADYIFITHSHYDHLSIEDIKKTIKINTILVSTSSGEEELIKKFPNNELIIVEPNKEYKLEGIRFETKNAYNINKTFHLKENNWVGYLIELDDLKYYIAGDTDFIKELENIKCDIAFLPIGGKYTMNYEEAAELANRIETKIVIPTHYGSIIGSKEDAYKFETRVVGKKVEIQIK